MAAARTRTGKKRILYEILHNLSFVDIFYDEKKTKRRVRTKTLGYFDAERIISSRQNSEVRMLLLLFLFHAVYNIK